MVVASGQLADIQKGERFEIADLLPLEGVRPLYRIKSELDGHERIAVRRSLWRAYSPSCCVTTAYSGGRRARVTLELKPGAGSRRS